MPTEEEMGYNDAIRQVERSIARRIKQLEDEIHHSAKTETLQARKEELEHLLETLETLRR